MLCLAHSLTLHISQFSPPQQLNMMVAVSRHENASWDWETCQNQLKNGCQKVQAITARKWETRTKRTFSAGQGSKAQDLSGSKTKR